MSEILATYPALDGEDPTVEGRIASIIEMDDARIKIGDYFLSGEQREMAEAIMWALCTTASGAGKGKCDPEHCVCGPDSRQVLRELKASGWTLTRIPVAVSTSGSRDK